MQIPWLSQFDIQFVKDFSTITAPLTEVVKKDVGFVWGKAQDLAFQKLNQKLCTALLVVLPNFSKTFEIESYASSVGSGAILI